jgi:hypothetical protein
LSQRTRHDLSPPFPDTLEMRIEALIGIRDQAPVKESFLNARLVAGD